jgi:hypothetical protein
VDLVDFVQEDRVPVIVLGGEQLLVEGIQHPVAVGGGDDLSGSLHALTS